jgi:hypothetical protein
MLGGVTRTTCGVLAACVLLAALPASAQRPFDAAPARPMRFAGYWDRDTGDPLVLGVVTVAGAVGAARPFGVTAAQAYNPPEEGVQVFRASSLQPTTLRLLGKDDMVRRFLGARPDQKVVALGEYTAGSATFVLAGVELEDTPAPSPSPSR